MQRFASWQMVQMALAHSTFIHAAGAMELDKCTAGEGNMDRYYERYCFRMDDHLMCEPCGAVGEHCCPALVTDDGLDMGCADDYICENYMCMEPVKDQSGPMEPYEAADATWPMDAPAPGPIVGEMPMGDMPAMGPSDGVIMSGAHRHSLQFASCPPETAGPMFHPARVCKTVVTCSTPQHCTWLSRFCHSSFTTLVALLLTGR